MQRVIEMDVIQKPIENTEAKSQRRKQVHFRGNIHCLHCYFSAVFFAWYQISPKGCLAD